MVFVWDGVNWLLVAGGLLDWDNLGAGEGDPVLGQTTSITRRLRRMRY